MTEWAAWEGTKSLSFLQGRVRQALASRGVEDGFVEHGGFPVHYYAAGPADAPRTVVLLHGLGDSANSWARALPLLAWRGDRVLAIDLPGHGYSPPHDAQRGFATVRESAEVVKHLVADLRSGDDLALVGHSLGGWVATRAHLAGLDASRLVLVESAGLVYEGMWDTLEMLRIEHEADVKRFFKTVCHKEPLMLHLLSREVASMFRTPAVVNFIAADNRNEILWDDELANVRARTTILWGENDGLIPPIIAHRWHAAIPRSELKWMPRCGHAPHFERPVLFQRLLEDALGHPPFVDHLRNKLSAPLPLWMRKHIAKA